MSTHENVREVRCANFFLRTPPSSLLLFKYLSRSPFKFVRKKLAGYGWRLVYLVTWAPTTCKIYLRYSDGKLLPLTRPNYTTKKNPFLHAKFYATEKKGNEQDIKEIVHNPFLWQINSVPIPTYSMFYILCGLYSSSSSFFRILCFL